MRNIVRDFILSLHKRWHFLLFAGVLGYLGACLSTMHDRTSIYQYQPFTLLTLFFVIGGGNTLYNGYLERIGKISFFNVVLSIFFWCIVAILVTIGGTLAAKELQMKYQIDLSWLLGFPL